MKENKTTINAIILVAQRHLLKRMMPILLIIFSGNTHRLLSQNWNEIIKTVATDRGASDLYGYSVAISGDYAIVGAYQEDHNLVGGQYLENAGAAYILKNTSGTWSTIQKIVAQDRAASDMFGYSVSISGNYAIVGAPKRNTVITGGTVVSDVGAVYMFYNNAGTWTQLKRIMASDFENSDEFGISVSISGDYAVVGAHQKNTVQGGLDLGNSGAAYILKKTNGNWFQDQIIRPSDISYGNKFGKAVSISGDYAIISAPENDDFDSKGNLMSNTGSAYIFKKTSSNRWNQVKKLMASDKAVNDEFGNSVSISGEYAIVGAMLEDENATGGGNLYSAGSVYIYKNKSETWTQQQKIVAVDRASDDRFGASVAISGEYLIVGAYNEDEDLNGQNTSSNSGSAYIYKQNSGSWSYAHKIIASDRAGADLFGASVAISGDYAIIGAYNEDEDLNGQKTLFSSGSSYIFKNCIQRGIDSQTACGSFTWIDGNTYTASNNYATYKIIGGAKNGCDSVVTLNLIIDSISNMNTTVSGATITASNTNATFRWLDCNRNYSVIAGETKSSYTPQTNGNYAVELTEKGCIDTTNCVSISSLGMIENTFERSLTVYPNPTNGNFSIDLGVMFEKIEVQITDIVGNLIESKTANQTRNLNLTVNKPAGIYFVKILAGHKKAVIPLIKE